MHSVYNAYDSFEKKVPHFLPSNKYGICDFRVEDFYLPSPNKNNIQVPNHFQLSLIRPKDRFSKHISLFEMVAGRLKSGFSFATVFVS